MALETQASSAGDMVLRVLRVGLHVGFAVLLGVGLVRVLLFEPSLARRLIAIALAPDCVDWLQGMAPRFRFASRTGVVADLDADTIRLIAEEELLALGFAAPSFG